MTKRVTDVIGRPVVSADSGRMLGSGGDLLRTDELMNGGERRDRELVIRRVPRPLLPGTTEGLISRTVARTDGLSAFDVAGVRSSPDVRDMSPQAIVEWLL